MIRVMGGFVFSTHASSLHWIGILGRGSKIKPSQSFAARLQGFHEVVVASFSLFRQSKRSTLILIFCYVWYGMLGHYSSK